jgi:hypothetical protein
LLARCFREQIGHQYLSESTRSVPTPGSVQRADDRSLRTVLRQIEWTRWRAATLRYIIGIAVFFDDPTVDNLGGPAILFRDIFATTAA